MNTSNIQQIVATVYTHMHQQIFGIHLDTKDPPLPLCHGVPASSTAWLTRCSDQEMLLAFINGLNDEFDNCFAAPTINPAGLTFARTRSALLQGDRRLSKCFSPTVRDGFLAGAPCSPCPMLGPLARTAPCCSCTSRHSQQ